MTCIPDSGDKPAAAIPRQEELAHAGLWDQELLALDFARRDYRTLWTISLTCSGIVAVRRQNRAKIFLRQWPPRTSGRTVLE